MAMLHELIKPGVPERLKRKNAQYIWDGKVLRKGGCICTACEITLFYSDWELYEPTVEDVLKERGWYWGSSFAGVYLHNGENTPQLIIRSIPTTAAEMTRIIDFLESLNK